MLKVLKASRRSSKPCCPRGLKLILAFDKKRSTLFQLMLWGEEKSSLFLTLHVLQLLPCPIILLLCANKATSLKFYFYQS